MVHIVNPLARTDLGKQYLNKISKPFVKTFKKKKWEDLYIIYRFIIWPMGPSIKRVSLNQFFIVMNLYGLTVDF
jgi:hypothetical protein